MLELLEQVPRLCPFVAQVNRERLSLQAFVLLPIVHVPQLLLLRYGALHLQRVFLRQLRRLAPLGAPSLSLLLLLRVLFLLLSLEDRVLQVEPLVLLPLLLVDREPVPRLVRRVRLVRPRLLR